MPFPKTYSFLLGILLGVAGFFWIAIGGFTSPEPQDTTRMEVSVAQLKSEDMWLEKVHFQLVPLAGVRSVHQYAILLLIPPAGGIPRDSKNTQTRLYMMFLGSGSIQPIHIAREDFGIAGDQVVVKFIDEMFRLDKSSYYQPSQHIWIGSNPY